MLVVLPNERNGLPTLLENLTSNVDELMCILDGDNFCEKEVYVGLPAFSIAGFDSHGPWLHFHPRIG